MGVPTMGKYVIVDEDNPEAIGYCDLTGLQFPKKDLVQQMEYRGNALVWTGFLVGRPYLDEPNPQLLPNIFPPDPMPVLMPRPAQPSVQDFNNVNIALNDWWVPLNAVGANFNGVPALSPSQRLSILRNPNLVINQNVAGGPLPLPPFLTEAQIKTELDEFYWGPNE